MLTEILCTTKKIKSNVNAIYVKRHHNDRYNNPAIEQTPKIESMPYYFMAIDNAKKVAEGHPEIQGHFDLIEAKFVTLYLIKNSVGIQRKKSAGKMNTSRNSTRDVARWIRRI